MHTVFLLGNIVEEHTLGTSVVLGKTVLKHYGKDVYEIQTDLNRFKKLSNDRFCEGTLRFPIK